MKPWSERPFSQVIRLRIRVLWGVIALMLVYMVAVAELGGGDSRRMTDLAQFAYRAIFYAGLAYAIARLVGSKKILRDRLAYLYAAGGISCGGFASCHCQTQQGMV